VWLSRSVSIEAASVRSRTPSPPRNGSSRCNSRAGRYAYRAGLDLAQVLRSVAGGGAASWSLSTYGLRMLSGDLDPGFLVEHFVKDMGIALAEARRMNLSLPGLALAEHLYVALMVQGPVSARIRSSWPLARLSDVDWLACTTRSS